MEIGIFAKTFARPTLEATLDAIASHSLSSVQFNMSCVGRPTLSDQVEDALCQRIAEAFQTRGLRMAAVSGTFNMIHPDPSVRRDGLRQLGVLISSCRLMGTQVVTLCTGTRDPESIWRRHHENDSKPAWNDLVDALRHVLGRAEPFGVTLAFEPEGANVVDSARKARRLLNEVASPNLKVVLDPANLLSPGRLPLVEPILAEAFALLGPDIVLAHAKDKARDFGEQPTAIGEGAVDFDLYLTLLERFSPGVPLIIHGIDEPQVAQSVDSLRGKVAALSAREPT
jgi:sugar phosphate isomerase/epimerase